MLCYDKSLQSCPTLCDPIDGSHQAPPSLGFSSQEHWSGLPFPSPMQESESEVTQSCPTLCDPMDCSPPGSSTHGIFQARALEWGAIAFSLRDHVILFLNGKMETSKHQAAYPKLQSPLMAEFQVSWFSGQAQNESYPNSFIFTQNTHILTCKPL